MIKRGLLAIAVLFTFAANAQNQWDLQRCLDYAIQNNVQLKITGLAQESNQANLLQSKMSRMPNLNFGGGQSWNFGFSIDQFTNQFTNQRVSNSNVGLTSNITIYNGSRISNTIKQNEYVLEASRYDYEQGKNDISLNVINGYLQVMFNRELLNVARLQLGNTDEQLKRTMTLIEAGSLPEANKYDILSQKALNENSITTSENNLALSIIRLKILMQMKADEPFDIVIPQLPEPKESDLPASIENIYNIAVSSQPNVKSADLGIKSAEMGVAIAKSNFLPSLTASGNITSGTSSQGKLLNRTTVNNTQVIGFLTNDITQTVSTIIPETTITQSEKPVFDQVRDNRRQSIGFNLNIPIFNRFQGKSAVANAKVATQRANLQAQAVRNTLRQNIEQSYADAKAAARTYASNLVRVNSLTESLKVIEQRFNIGTANSLDYALARNNLNIAQADLVRSKYEFTFRLKILDFYAGKQLKF